MNTRTKKPLPRWLPLLVGALLVAQFAGLGAWQISRGFEKRANQAAFRGETGFAAWQDGMEVRPYQRLKATGRYDGDHQVLLENIIINSRYGYYVLTPLAGEEGEPPLLVNRGWIEKAADDVDLGALEVSSERVEIHVIGRLLDPAAIDEQRGFSLFTG